MDFVQSCTNQLLWLSEKEKIELSRDWASKELNTQAIEQYYEVSPTFYKMSAFPVVIIIKNMGDSVIRKQILFKIHTASGISGPQSKKRTSKESHSGFFLHWFFFASD